MNILAKADELVNGDRAKDYGHPLDNHSVTAEMFSAFVARKYGLNVTFQAEDVAVFNMVQKIARLSNSPGHMDSLVDIAGYAATYQMILDKRETK